MLRVNVHDAKTNLSKYLKRVARGETIIVCRRNIPIAEIRPVSQQRLAKRPIGLCKGMFEIPPEFYEPLPPDLLALFNGEGPEDIAHACRRHGYG